MRRIWKFANESVLVLSAFSRAHAIIEFEPDGKILTANDLFLRLMGYDLAGIVGQHHSIFVPANERATPEYQGFWRGLANGTPQMREVRRLTRTGESVWWQASYDPVFDKAGRVVKVMTIATDITAERLRIADLEGQIQAIWNSQAVISFSPEGIVLDANPIFLQLKGYTLEEVRGQHHRLFVDKAEAASPAYAAFWQILNDGKPQVAEFRRIGKGGKEVWIQGSYTPIRNLAGQVYKIIKYATDVTAERLRLADFEGQINAINSSQAVIQFNMDGTILGANDNFLRTMGYSLEEVRGKHHRLFVDPTEANGAAYAEFWERLRHGEPLAAEYRRIAKSGKEVWIRATYTPIMDMNGRPFKVVKYATDVTAQIAARGIAHEAAHTTVRRVDTVATAAEEMSASIGKIATSMARSREMIQDIRLRTTAADQATARLHDASLDMDKVTQFIQQIARQIALLSLNATIEAARAGEAGKGFAVVASEVKSLATQTSEATGKISSEISSMHQVVQDVIGALGAINDAVGSIQEVVTSVAGAAEEQSSVTQEISTSMQAAAQSVAHVTRSLQELAGMNSLAA